MSKIASARRFYTIDHDMVARACDKQMCLSIFWHLYGSIATSGCRDFTRKHSINNLDLFTLTRKFILFLYYKFIYYKLSFIMYQILCQEQRINSKNISSFVSSQSLVVSTRFLHEIALTTFSSLSRFFNANLTCSQNQQNHAVYFGMYVGNTIDFRQILSLCWQAFVFLWAHTLGCGGHAPISPVAFSSLEPGLCSLDSLLHYLKSER